MLNHPRPHPIVKVHGAVLEMVLEMDVNRPRRQVVGDPAKRQVVGRDQADGARSISPPKTDSAPTERSWELVP